MGPLTPERNHTVQKHHYRKIINIIVSVWHPNNSITKPIYYTLLAVCHTVWTTSILLAAIRTARYFCSVTTNELISKN